MFTFAAAAASCISSSISFIWFSFDKSKNVLDVCEPGPLFYRHSLYCISLLHNYHLSCSSHTYKNTKIKYIHAHITHIWGFLHFQQFITVSLKYTHSLSLSMPNMICVYRWSNSFVPLSKTPVSAWFARCLGINGSIFGGLRGESAVDFLHKWPIDNR